MSGPWEEALLGVALLESCGLGGASKSIWGWALGTCAQALPVCKREPTSDCLQIKM